VEGVVDVQVGSTITNGSSCIRVTERVERDPRWRAPGWRGLNIGLEAFGGNTGTTGFVPDHLLSGWYHVPFEWRPVVGGELEERYVWSADWTRLQREVRPRPLAVGDHVKFRDDNGGGEGVGLVYRVEPGKVWVDTAYNRWRAADPAWFVRTPEPLTPGAGDGLPEVQPTVDGIRGHRVDTPADAALRDALGVGEPITRADAQRLMAELGVDELDLVQRQDHDIRGDW
jgi:hypothetical protein